MLLISFKSQQIFKCKFSDRFMKTTDHLLCSYNNWNVDGTGLFKCMRTNVLLVICMSITEECFPVRP